MSMPETTIDEDDRSIRRKYQVGRAGQPAVMEPKTKPPGVQAAANHKLWLGVSRPDPRHVEPTLIRRERVVADGPTLGHGSSSGDAADTASIAADGFGEGLDDLARHSSRQQRWHGITNLAE